MNVLDLFSGIGGFSLKPTGFGRGKRSKHQLVGINDAKFAVITAKRAAIGKGVHRLRVAFESSSTSHEIVERALAVMSERWMTDIVEKGGRFAQG